MAIDGVPAGDIAVFVVCELFALPFAFDGNERLRAGEPWSKVILSWIIALALILLGILFPWMRKKLGARISGWLDRLVHNRTFWITGDILAVVLLVSLGVGIYHHYHRDGTTVARSSEPKANSSPAQPVAPSESKPPNGGGHKPKKQGEKPDGAPWPAPDEESEKRDTEWYYTMSRTEQRDEVAREFTKLKIFEGKWHNLPSSPDGDITPPAIQDASPASQRAMHEYWGKVEAKRKYEEETLPTNRFKAFQKEFPQMREWVVHLQTSLQDIPYPRECFPVGKMSADEMMSCTQFFEKGLEEYKHIQ
jgi:hypothetical protein